MNNKKILITVIIATILALSIVLLIFLPQYSKKETQKLPDKIEQKDVKFTPEIKQIPAIKSEEQETSNIQQSKTPVKQIATPKSKNTKKNFKPVSKPQETIKPAVQKIQAAKETKSENIEEEVIIPVEYTTKNTYKYVYTPTKFSEK